MTSRLVVLACADLMTASRLDAVPGLDVRTARTATRALELVAAAGGDAVLVVDLATVGELGELLGGDDAPEVAGIVAFAPHVQVERLEAARAWADVVAPRGATVRALADQVARAVDRRAARGAAAAGRDPAG